MIGQEIRPVWQQLDQESTFHKCSVCLWFLSLNGSGNDVYYVLCKQMVTILLMTEK